MYNERHLLFPSVRRAAKVSAMVDVTPPEDEIRLPLLQQLAEQAMSDPAFREIARDDLGAALDAHGYRLNERELALVMRFRAALAEAGVDLFLDDAVNDERLAQVLRSQF